MVYIDIPPPPRIRKKQQKILSLLKDGEKTINYLLEMGWTVKDSKTLANETYLDIIFILEKTIEP